MQAGKPASARGQCELTDESLTCTPIATAHTRIHNYLPYVNFPHSVVVFCIASNVNIGISSPEKNATFSVCPVT